jgi:hypothetical protein
MVFSRTFMGRRDWKKWGILGRAGGTFECEQMRRVGVSEGEKKRQAVSWKFDPGNPGEITTGRSAP